MWYYNDYVKLATIVTFELSSKQLWLSVHVGEYGQATYLGCMRLEHAHALIQGPLLA